MELVGQKIAQYEITEKLGTGGMGEVYKAKDTRLGRTVAIKMLTAQATKDESLKRRFLIEARAASALNHPYILTVYEVGRHEDYDYMVMEYVRGITLRERIAQGQLGLMEALDTFLKVAEGLLKAHEARIIHRDLKPENIMITEDGFVKILDFGLAKLEQDFAEKSADEMKSDPNIIQGTVGYLAPEMIECQPADARSDIFALGVIIYESLIGRTPFEGRNLGERLVATMQREPRPITELRGDLPPELEDLVKQTLAKSPEDRYQSLAPILETLRAIKRDLDLEVSISERSLAGDEASREILDRLRRSPVSGELRLPASALPKITNSTDATETQKIMLEAQTKVSNAQQTGSWRRRPYLKYLAACIALISVLGLGFWGWSTYRGQPNNEINLTDPNSNGRVSLAVIYFENISHDEDLKWLERGIAEMLTTNLAQYESIDILSSQQLYELLRRFQKGDQKEEIVSFDHNTALEIARRARVKSFITGTFFKVDNHIRLSITLEDTTSGKILFSDKVDAASVDQIFNVVDKVTFKIAERLGSTGGKGLSISEVSTESVAAFKHYEQGIEKVTKLHLKDAAMEFEKAISIDPNFAMAYLQLGIAKLRSEDEKGTREAIMKAVELIDRVAPKERLFIRGLEAVIDGKAEKRIDCFREITERYPNDKEAYRQLGMAYLADEQLEAAIKSFQQALRIDPEYSEGYNRLAYAFLSKGDNEIALSNARKYVSIMPDEPNPHDTLGDIYLGSGRIDDAIAEYEKIISLRPDFINYFPYWKLAGAYRAKGDLDRATEGYKRHLELRKEGPGADSIKSLAMIALLRGEKEQAVKLLNEAITGETQRGQVTMAVLTCLELEIFYLEQKDFTAAQDYAQRARKLLAEQSSQLDIFSRYNDRIMEFNYLRLITAMGDYARVEAEAESYLEKQALHYTPFSRDLFRLNVDAMLAQGQGNYSEALNKWQQLRAKNGLKRGNNYNIALCLYKLNRISEAEKEFETIINTAIVMHQQASNAIGVDAIFDLIRSYYYLGLIAEMRGDTTAMNNYFKQIQVRWPRLLIRLPEIVELEKRANSQGRKGF